MHTALWAINFLSLNWQIYLVGEFSQVITGQVRCIVFTYIFKFVHSQLWDFEVGSK